MKVFLLLVFSYVATISVAVRLGTLTAEDEIYGREVVFGSQTYRLKTWTGQVPAAPESNMHDRGSYWKWHAELRNSEGQPVNIPVNRIFNDTTCIPTDDHEIARMVIENQTEAFISVNCIKL